MNTPAMVMVDYEVFIRPSNAPTSDGVTFWTMGATSIRVDLSGDDTLLFLYTGTIDGEQILMGEYTTFAPGSYIVSVRAHGGGNLATITADFSGVVRIDG